MKGEGESVEVIGRVFDQAPARVYWELTRACDLACRHCRAEAIKDRGSDELGTDQCEAVLRELAGAGPVHVIFTGGDPLKREDLLSLVGAAARLGLDVSIAPSATQALSCETVDRLKTAGVSALSLSLDGAVAADHDGIRGVAGCFEWTLAAAQWTAAAGIPLQVNTLVTADTEPRLAEIGNLVARLGASRWSLFFLVQVGRGRILRPLAARACEVTLRWLAARSTWPFTVTTTEAPHYRRVLIEQMRRAGCTDEEIQRSAVGRGFGIRDGNGIMFIAANGDVRPSGFLPLSAGNVRDTNPLRIYRDAPLFRALRSPDRFHGRCGTCAFRSVCGGSRARAYAATGDALGSDPLCAYKQGLARHPSARERPRWGGSSGSPDRPPAGRGETS